MTPAESLLSRARDYELLAAWHAERGPVSQESARSAVGFLVVAIVLYEVAALLEDDFEAAA
ncbi:MAG TPA: hypothetical protein VH816_14265 [Gaiellaceae bacterium]